MARKIVVTSGKGGVGKTTLTANLGFALASMGLKVAMIDVDFGLNNLDVIVGVERKIVFDIVDVVEGRCRLRQALVQSDKYKNLFVLSSGKSGLANSVTGQNIKLIIESMNLAFDYILIDCPAGIDLGFHRAVSCADEAIIVVTAGATSLRDADKISAILKSYKMDKISVVVNRVRGDLILCGKVMSPFDVKELLRTELLGVLPEEDVIFLSNGGGLPKNSDSIKAYKILATNIHTGSRKIYDVTKKYTGFFGSIRRGMKKII